MVDHMNRDYVVTRDDLDLSNINCGDAKLAAQLAAEMAKKNQSTPQL